MEPRPVLLIHSGELGWGDLRALLRSIPDLMIVGEARNREQAFQLAASHPPRLFSSVRQWRAPVLPHSSPRCSVVPVLTAWSSFSPSGSTQTTCGSG